MSATCTLLGRLGNSFYQIAHLIAYATQYNIPYFTPDNSPFKIKSIGKKPIGYSVYKEPTPAAYHLIPKINNVSFSGYWQSFKYIDPYSDAVLKAFKLPYKPIDAVAIHVRRGDFLTHNGFSILPYEYYERAIDYFISLGYKRFIVFSDDIAWCKKVFEGAEFSEGLTDMQDFIKYSNCAHSITANSSFSFAASWLNQNHGKIVLCPDAFDCWYNKDFIPDYYKIVDYRSKRVNINTVIKNRDIIPEPIKLNDTVTTGYTNRRSDSQPRTSSKSIAIQL